MTLAPIATTTDLSDRLGRALTPLESARAPALLRDASSQIRRYCRPCDFLYHADDTVVLPAQGGKIRLPYTPIQTVTSVVALSGNPTIPDIVVTWYTFDGIDELIVPDVGSSGVINLPESFYDNAGAYPGTYEITYSHGYTTPPDEAVMVAANAVISVLQAPTMAAGVIGETVGAYSYRLERGGGGLAVALTEADLTALDDFRPKYGTIKLGRGLR